MDWKKIVGAVAPTLGTALLGPMGGAAVKVIADQVLGKPEATESEVAEAVMTGLNPEAIVELRKADQAFAIRLKELDIDIMRLNADLDKAYVADVQDARQAHSKNPEVFWLGIAILVTFGLVMGAVMWGSFLLLTGGIKPKDVATVGLVSGLIGTVVGYVAANAQQVVGYFYGSSQGSKDKTDAIASAVAKLGNRP